MPGSWDGLIIKISNTTDLTMDSTVSLFLFKKSHRIHGVSSSREVMNMGGKSTERGSNERDKLRSKSREQYENVRC